MRAWSGSPGGFAGKTESSGEETGEDDISKNHPWRPFQVMKDFGAFEFNADFGYVWRRGGNSWFGGVAVGREVGQGVEVAAELHWDGDAHFGAKVLTANVGVRVALSEKFTLLVSAGRELHNADEPRATLVGYLGLQTVF